MFKSSVSQFITVIYSVEYEAGAGNVSGSVLSRDQVSNQVEDIRLKLTSSQNRIITFCTSPRSAQEIMDEIGVTNQYNNRQRQFIVESE